MSSVTSLEPMALDLHLPWEADEHREEAFRRTLKRLIIPLLVLFVVVPWLPTFDTGLELEQDMVKRTQVLLDPIEQPEPEPVAPEPPPPEEPKPKPVEPAVAPTPKPQPAATPAPAEPDARESVAASQGMDELSNQLSAVRSAVNVASMQRKNLSDNRGGEVARTERARLGREMQTRSNGTVVDESVMTSDITALSAHQATDVEGLDMDAMPASSGPNSHRSGQLGQRDMESIRRKLEQAKGNVYALYQRALQDNPNLTGEFTFKLVIEPNGTISQLTLLVSELGLSNLEQQILTRIEQVNFGAMDVPPTVVEYRFVFLPS